MSPRPQTAMKLLLRYSSVPQGKHFSLPLSLPPSLPPSLPTIGAVTPLPGPIQDRRSFIQNATIRENLSREPLRSQGRLVALCEENAGGGVSTLWRRREGAKRKRGRSELQSVHHLKFSLRKLPKKLMHGKILNLPIDCLTFVVLHPVLRGAISDLPTSSWTL